MIPVRRQDLDDGRPVYRKKATQCSRIETPGSREAGHAEYMLQCDKSDQKPAFIYWDAKRTLWKIGDDKVGSSQAHIVSKSGACGVCHTPAARHKLLIF